MTMGSSVKDERLKVTTVKPFEERTDRLLGVGVGEVTLDLESESPPLRTVQTGKELMSESRDLPH